MDFFDLINKRESCRNYNGQSVESEKLDRCIEAARLSPSACNSQPWFYYVVNGGEKAAEQRSRREAERLTAQQFFIRCRQCRSPFFH